MLINKNREEFINRLYPAAFIVYNLTNTNISFDEYLMQIGLKNREKLKIKATEEEIREIHERANEILKRITGNEKNI